MSLLFGRQARANWPPEILVPARNSGLTSGVVNVTTDTARRHSAVWACQTLRANLVSTMPVKVYRRVDGMDVETPVPAVLSLPGGERVNILEWLYSSQIDLDGTGNAFGIITKRDGFGLPARIELQDHSTVVVVVRRGVLVGYRISGTMYDPADVWHEKQHTVSGLHVGLSALAYAAWSISEYLSAQQFAISWFSDGAIPSARLKNNSKLVGPKEAETVKATFRSAVANRDILVLGSDWDYDMIQGDSSTNQLLETKRYSVSDICRFLGVPGDLVDASESLGGGKITYANMTQRNLEFLIMHLSPSLVRREAALSTIVPALRRVQFDREALLQMDPAGLAAMVQTEINSRTLAPSEARATRNRPPFTPDQVAEFTTLFGPPGGAGVPATKTTTTTNGADS